MNNKLISIIIVNWNGKKLLERCLKSLASQRYIRTEIIVVDNGSTDGSKVYVKKNFPYIKLIENKTNLGFAQANNIGYDFAKGEYILFLNNDTQVTADFLKPLSKELESNQKIGGVQSKILLLEDKTKLDSIGAFFTNTGFLYHHGFRKQDQKKYQKQIELFSAKGACTMFKKKVLEKVLVENEVFDSRYFAYFEETDLCHRVWLSGFRIRYIPDSVIYHSVGATSSKMREEFIQYHSFKNRIDSYLKNLSLEYLIKIIPLHFGLCIAAIFFYVLKGKPMVSLVIVKAIIWNFVNVPTTLKKRINIQKNIRRISDYKFLPKLTKQISLSYFIAHLRGLESYKEIS